jgi:hypothetical protein
VIKNNPVYIIKDNQKAINTKLIQEDIDYINKTLSEEPKHVLADDLIYLKAKYYLLLGDNDAAVNSLYLLVNDYKVYFFNDIGEGIVLNEQLLNENGRGLFYVTPEALYELASIYIKLKKYDKAIECLNRLEIEYPSSNIFVEQYQGKAAPEAKLLKAKIYLEHLNSTNEAMNCYKLILLQYSTDARYKSGSDWAITYIALFDQLPGVLSIDYQKKLYEDLISESVNIDVRNNSYIGLINMEKDSAKKLILYDKAINDILIKNVHIYSDYHCDYEGDNYLRGLYEQVGAENNRYIKLMNEYEKLAKTKKVTGYILYAKANYYFNLGNYIKAKSIYYKLMNNYADVKADEQLGGGFGRGPYRLADLARVRLAYIAYYESNSKKAEILLKPLYKPETWGGSFMIEDKIRELMNLLKASK